MLQKLKELWLATMDAKRQSVSMQHKLGLYWMSMAMAILAALILVLSFAGVFSDPAQKVSDALRLQQRNTVSALSEQLSGLNGQCIKLSQAISTEISNTLKENGASLQDLNNNQALIQDVEGAIYEHLHSTLLVGDCNGVFALLNATVNTQLEYASTSRMGLYLRYSDLNSTTSANQHLVFYRGVSDIARIQQMEMHNRWNLEFDTAFLPGYEEMMIKPVNRLATAGVWSERTQLKDTWEDVMLLYVPILDWDGQVCGLCGIELSELYFRLSYPSVASNYGDMVTVLAPLDGNTLNLEQAMLGDAMRLRLEPKGVLRIKEGNFYNTYSNGTKSYIGVHQTIGSSTVYGRELAVVTLISQSSYEQMATASRNIWILGSLAFLICMLVLSLSLSHRFVRPILQSISRFQDAPADNPSSGFHEIDQLLALIQSTSWQKQMETELPPELDRFFSDFIACVQTLTPMERTVLQYYIEGCDINEVSQRTFISINTAKKHNTNINRKLGVSSREELMLCIDLFRRCGKLKQISYHT